MLCIENTEYCIIINVHIDHRIKSSTMKTIKIHTVETVPISNSKFAERGNIETLNVQIQNRSLSLPGTGTLVKK